MRACDKAGFYHFASPLLRSDCSSSRSTGQAAWASASQRRSTFSTVAAGMIFVTSRMKERAMIVAIVTARNSAAIHQMRQIRPKPHAAAARPMMTPQALSFGSSMSR